MWTTADKGGGGVGHKQEVHQSKIFTSESQNILRFEGAPTNPPILGRPHRIALSNKAYPKKDFLVGRL